MKKITLFIIFCILCSSHGYAEDHFSIGPKFGYIFLSKNLSLENGYVYGIDAEYKASDKWRVEFEFLSSAALDTNMEEKGYMQAISANSYLPYNGNTKLYSYNINMLYRFAQLNRFESFLKFGLGYTYTSGKIERQERTFNYGAGGSYHYPYKVYDNYNTFNANIGISLHYRISDIFSIQIDAHDIVMFSKADFAKLETPYHNLVTSCGICFTF